MNTIQISIKKCGWSYDYINLANGAKVGNVHPHQNRYRYAAFNEQGREDSLNEAHIKMKGLLEHYAQSLGYGVEFFSTDNE